MIRCDQPPQRREVERRPVRSSPSSKRYDGHRSAGTVCSASSIASRSASERSTVARVLVQPRDHRRVHVLGDHQLVAQVERRRVDPPGQQLERLGEVGAVVRDRAAVREVDGHAVTPPGAARRAASSWPAAAARCASARRRAGRCPRRARASACRRSVLTASESPLNRFSSRSRSSCGTIAVCSSGRSIE